MSWILFAGLSISLFSILSLLQRTLALESKSTRAMSVAFNMVAAFFAILLFFITGSYKSFALPTDYRAYVAALFASFFYAMFERGRFAAAKLLDASVLTTIANISLVISFFGSIILYSETLTLKKLAGCLLILVALLIVSYTKKASKLSKKGIITAVIIFTMYGFATMLDKLGANYFNPSTYSIFVWTVPILFIYFPYVKTTDIKAEFKGNLSKILVLAIINVAAFYFQLKALNLGEATTILPILQMSTLITIALGIIFLKERDRIPNKILAGIIAVVGTILLV